MTAPGKSTKKHRNEAVENGIAIGVGIGFLVYCGGFLWVLGEKAPLTVFYIIIGAVILLAVGIGKEAYDRAKIT